MKVDTLNAKPLLPKELYVGKAVIEFDRKLGCFCSKFVALLLAWAMGPQKIRPKKNKTDKKVIPTELFPWS